MHESSLAEHFLNTGLVTRDQLRIAQKESRVTGMDIGQALLASGFVSQALLRDARSQLVGRASIELDSIQPQSVALDMIGASLARQHLVLPLAFDAATNTLGVAMEKAHDLPALDSIAAALSPQTRLEISLASRTDILAAIDRHYGSDVSIEALLALLDSDAAAAENPPDTVESSTTVQLVEALLADATRCGASDIHFEPEAGFLRVRYRVDGVLRQVRSVHKHYWSQLLVRIKIISGMNIAETRAAQDGRFALMVIGRDMDFRVSCFPSVHGENIVIRLLDRSARLMNLGQLGLPATTLRSLRRIIRKPAGLIIMSGPTGSGKSTTLYSVLNEIRHESINIVTMEDPVEYSLPLLRQCSVNAALKLDFATGIRALLRQDPDVILVGETRDRATAGMVVQAALTGHLVLTTLHSQTALGALSRLQDLGLDLSCLGGNILALVSQRLVRQLCVNCKAPVPVPECLLAFAAGVNQVFEAAGCELCDGTGYRGRQAVVELYQPSGEVHTMLASRSSPGSIFAQVRSEEHAGLAAQGIECVIQGSTSLQELSRVINLDQLLVAA